MVDHIQETGKIDYKKSDQVEAFQQIVDLIDVYPPIVVFSRLTKSFNRVSHCRRRKGESISSFVSRFFGLASEHLMHADSSSNSKIGELLAITLLTSASLGEKTHRCAKSQLMQKKPERPLLPMNSSQRVKSSENTAKSSAMQTQSLCWP